MFFYLYGNSISVYPDKEEEKKKQEWREIAKKELEEWYRNHEEAIAKTKAANRYVGFVFVFICSAFFLLLLRLLIFTISVSCI